MTSTVPTTDAPVGTPDSVLVEAAADHRLTGIGVFPQGLTRYDAYQDSSPVIHVQEPEGSYWVCLDRALATACLQDSATFSNAATSPFHSPDIPVLPPVTLDPPDHTNWRRLLNPFFSGKRVQQLEDRVRERTAELLDGIVERGECDFVKEFAFQLPTVIFLEVVGLPADELPQFLTWMSAVVHPSDDTGTIDSDAAAASMGAIAVRFSEVVAERRANPDPAREDLISAMITWEIDGRPLDDGELLMCGVLLFIAGLDTVANAMAYSVRHLATHPEDRALLTSGTLSPADVAEEMLRSYPIPEITRLVTRDVELGGQQLRAGDCVLFPMVALNRDPNHVDGGREVRLGRTDVPVALGFGTGPHRCLGVHLARLEMRTFLEMWHERVPDYRLEDDGPTREYWGPVHGMKTLRLRW